MLSCTPPPRYLGLDAYRHQDKLSYLSIGDRIAGESTADPAGANADSTHILRMLLDGERMLFDQTGSGILTFMRMQESLGGPWRLYLDGAHPVTIAAGDLGRGQPGSFPASAFPFPLSLNSAETQGSSIVAGAIPFRDPPNWWGTFHATYTSVPTPRPGEDMTFLNVHGSVRIVGTVVNVTRIGSTLEGNPSFYLDDSQAPQIEPYPYGAYRKTPSVVPASSTACGPVICARPITVAAGPDSPCPSGCHVLERCFS